MERASDIGMGRLGLDSGSVSTTVTGRLVVAVTRPAAIVAYRGHLYLTDIGSSSPAKAGIHGLECLNGNVHG